MSAEFDSPEYAGPRTVIQKSEGIAQGIVLVDLSNVPADSIETFFRASGVPLLPWNIHDVLLWAILPQAWPHRAFIVDVFADGLISSDQKRTVLAYLGWQTRGYLDRDRMDQAEIMAEFARSLANSAGIREDEGAFASMAERARSEANGT